MPERPAGGPHDRRPTRSAGAAVRLVVFVALVASSVGASLPAPSEPPGAAPSDGAPLRTEIVTDGGLADRVSRSPADLVLYIAGEQRGSMETCGCPHRPRGSLARMVAYVTASRGATEAPSLLLNPGRWLADPAGLDGTPQPETVALNGWMVRGLSASGWDALNVTPSDAAGIAALDPGLSRSLPLVSASIVGPGVARWRIVERGGRKIGITGIAADELTGGPIPGFEVHSPDRARATVEELAAQVDLIVLLEWRSADAAARLARQIPKVAVVVDANDHTGQQAPFFVGNALWVWSDFEALRVGELRLGLQTPAGDTAGPIAGALDRHIDMDPQVPDDRTIAGLQRRAREDLDHGAADPHGADPQASAALAARHPSPMTPVEVDPSAHYVGAAACSGCHASAAATWSASAHARSLEALATQRSAHNPQCVGCHVTGYGRRGYSGEISLAAVGCEACHGPGSGHASRVAVPASVHPYGALPTTEAACAGCHTAETAPDFAFTEAWAQIRHDDPKTEGATGP